MVRKLFFIALVVFLLGGGDNLFAQKGLYLGAGIGGAGTGGDIGRAFDGGGGFHAMLGFKPAEKWGLELEYGAYQQEVEKQNQIFFEGAGFGQILLNFKYFWGSAQQRTFRPYISAGLGASVFAWDYTDGLAGLVTEEQDGVAALSLLPGIGFEVMVGRIAAFNLNGRFSLNGWGEETAKGHELPIDIDGNSMLLNLGLVLHL